MQFAVMLFSLTIHIENDSRVCDMFAASQNSQCFHEHFIKIDECFH